MKAYHAALGHAWAITQDGLQLILDVTSREQNDTELAAEMRREFEAVSRQSGTKMDGTKGVTVRGRVATMNVRGPITPYASMFGDVSGATSVESLAKEFNVALANPDIESIVLRIDSPGGSATDIQEFADMIYQARGQKNIVAYCGGQACSAAYWLAAACNEVVASRTAVLGSIGVITAVPKSEADPKTVQFVSSQSPNKRPNPETEEGANEIQTMLDDMADEFVGAVATYRHVSADHVLKNFGQGGVMVGKRAVSAGLADRLGSYEGVVKQLNEGVGDMGRTKTRTKATDETVISADESDKAEIAEAFAAAIKTGEDAVIVTEAVASAMASLAAGAEDAAAVMDALVGASAEGNATLEATIQDSVDLAKAQLAADVAAAETIAEPSVEDLMRAELEQLRAEKLQLETDRELSVLAAYATEHGWYGDSSAHATFMHALDETQRAYFQRQMNAYAEQVKAGALFGHNGVSNPGGEFASATAEYLGLVAEEEAKLGCSYERAMVSINKKHPELRQAYLAEQRSKK